MIHLALEVLLGAGVSVALALAAAWTAIGLAVLAEWVRRHLSRKRRAVYEQYAAEQAIRAIKRRAILDLLAAERGYRARSTGDVIEGTAVEVER
jgi:hypothetical protein